MRASLLILTLTVLFALGCQPPPPEISPPATAAPTAEADPAPPFLPSGMLSPGDPPAPYPVTPSPLVQANTAFACDLYHQLRTQDGNLFLSPFSISTALAMTYAGARGQTAREMAQVLHFPPDPAGPHADFRGLLTGLNERGQGGSYELSTANALWGQRGSGFLPAFLQVTRDHYGAGLREVDFAGNPEAARQEINAWAARETRDKIPELVSRDLMSSGPCLVLTNAIYFKGRWHHPFNKEHTRDQPFQVSASEKVGVPLMSQQGEEFLYMDGGTFQALELPYVGRDLAMLILLPRTVDGLPALEKALSPKLLTLVLQRMRRNQLDEVSLPRFRLESSFPLKDDLIALGMPSAFGGAADFSGLNGHGGLHISQVVHKTFADVNEEGTEAAAATAVLMAMCSHPSFRADHPFLFLIRDTTTGTILFLGRFVRPAA